MKVVMVGPFGLRPHGTMSRRALPLAKALAVRGHDVEVVLPPWSCPEDSGQERTEDSVFIHNIHLPASIPVTRDILLVWRLVRRALDGHPRVLHFFKPKGYSGLVALLVWCLRGLRLIDVRVVLDSDDWEGPEGWNDLGNYSWLERRLFAWQERWGMTHCRALTVASRTLQGLALEMGLERDRIFYLPNGITLGGGLPDPRAGVRMRRKFGMGNDPVVLLYTRFFEFEPGRVIDILSRVVREAPSSRLLVVGRGMFGEEGRFLSLVEDAGLESRVTYVGWQGGADLPGYFAAADMAICPLEDTLLNRARCPAKVVDLMEAGLPVVADRVGQVSEYIEHLSSGYLVAPGDANSFATGILRLLGDEQLRVRLGSQARRRARERFSWHKLAAVAEKAYLG
jgi:glycosyltransferase involved in cell wall biosynthesis